VFASAPVKQRISADHLQVLVSTPTSTPIRVLSECMIFTVFVLIGFRIKPDYTEMHTIYSRLRLQVLFPAPNNPDRKKQSGLFLFQNIPKTEGSR